MSDPPVTVLAGGVGGARFLQGLVDVVAPERIVVVGNVGDDVEPHGLHVSPDLDTVLYTLTGQIDHDKGWGVRGDSDRALERARSLGADAWFWLGDLDIGLHLARTEALRAGEPLSAITARLTAAVGLELTLLPATDDRLRTWLDTPAGSWEFQEWFVRRGHRDPVDRVRFEGAGAAAPAPGVLAALAGADVIAIAPSNPYVSIHPILAVAAIRDALANRRAPVVAVSPLIGGRAVKGPAASMLERLAGGTTPAHVAACYEGLVDALVIDPEDDPAELDVRTVVTPTLLDDPDTRRRVAEAVLDVAGAPA